MPDRLPTGAARTGAALATPVVARMLTGAVVEYFSSTHSYRVRTGRGELAEVPRIARDPGDNTILPVGTIVVLHNDLGFWVIDGVLKQTPANAQEFNRISVSEAPNIGGNDPQNTQDINAASYRGSGDPKDMLPNDWVRHSGDGNFMGVLAGGMNTMHSAPFAQVRTHAASNSVEILAHEYRHLSSMGDLEIKNDGGKTSLVWRAGADQSTENGANATNWTLRLDAGAEGNLFRFRVTTPQGQTLSEIHVSPEGKLSLVAADGVDITSNSFREDVLGDHASNVDGALAQTIGGEETRSVGADRTTLITQNDKLAVGGGQAVNVTGNQAITIGGGLTQSIGTSSRIDVVSGYLDVVLGDLAKLGKDPGSLCFVNYKGDIQVLPGPSGKFTAFGNVPGSIELGADAIPVPRADGSTSNNSVATYSAMLFEHFNSMMTTLLNALDTHVHGSAMGPTTNPVVPFTPVVNPQITPIQSLRVKLGG